MADIFSIIADPTRRQLLAVLLDRAAGGGGAAARGEHSVSELVARLELSQPTVSKHLKVLRDADLVLVREEGQHRYYRLNAQPLGEVEEWMDPFLSDRLPSATSALPSPAGATEDVAREGSVLGRLVGRSVADSAHRARAVAERLGLAAVS